MAVAINPVLPLSAPSPQDVWLCDAIFGNGNIITNDCLTAVERSPLFAGDAIINYSIFGRTGNVIPFAASHGTCTIRVNIAGPNLPSHFPSRPSALRGLALWIIAECVAIRNVGGFVTTGLNNLVRYVTSPLPLPLTVTAGISRLSFATYPSSTAFVTIAISGPGINSLRPGDTDPMIPAHLAKNLAILYEFTRGRNRQSSFRDGLAKAFTDLTLAQRRGSPTPWWNPRSITDDMTYECSTELGNPSEVDCTQIEWNQLSPPADTVHLDPGNPVFLHSNTCYLAISASISLVLTWAQIRTALSTLMTLCVQDPVQTTAQGGRAYYEPQQPAALSGRRRRRRRRREIGGPPGTDNMTGLNALPPHANLTLFQQTEPFRSVAEEMKSCTWMAAQKGTSVAGCH